MTGHNNVKIYNAFFPQKQYIFLTFRHSSQRTLISLSRHYIARGGTAMNQTLKIVIFFTMHIFS